MSIPKYTKLNTPDFWDKKIKKFNKKINKSSIYLEKNNIVIKLLTKSHGNLLNLGFGYGFLDLLIHENKLKYSIYGIDISRFAVKHMSKLGIGEYEIGNISNIKHKSKKFDVVIALDVIEHLNNVLLRKSITEMYRVLNDDGTVIISVPLNENSRDYRNNHHMQKFDYFKLNRLLTSNNFYVLRSFKLAAFESNFKIKNFINNYVFKFRQPNLLIIEAKKK